MSPTPARSGSVKKRSSAPSRHVTDHNRSNEPSLPGARWAETSASVPCSRSASGRASSRASGANPALESSTIQSNIQVIQYLAEVSWCRVRRDIAVGPQHGDLAASGGEPAAQLAVGILDQVQA